MSSVSSIFIGPSLFDRSKMHFQTEQSPRKAHQHSGIKSFGNPKAIRREDNDMPRLVPSGFDNDASALAL